MARSGPAANNSIIGIGDGKVSLQYPECSSADCMSLQEATDGDKTCGHEGDSYVACQRKYSMIKTYFW